MGVISKVKRLIQRTFAQRSCRTVIVDRGEERDCSDEVESSEESKKTAIAEEPKQAYLGEGVGGYSPEPGFGPDSGAERVRLYKKWRDNDPRLCGERIVEIVGLHSDGVEVLSNKSSRVTRISYSMFDKKYSGKRKGFTPIQ